MDSEEPQTFTKHEIGEYMALQQTVESLLMTLQGAGPEAARIARAAEHEVDGFVGLAEGKYVDGEIDEETLKGIKAGVNRLFGKGGQPIL